MKKTLTYGLILFTTLFACRNDTDDPTFIATEISIKLRWIPSYAGETKEEAVTAFKWAMSFLGAELPSDLFDQAVKFEGEQIFEANFSKMGFSENALEALSNIVTLLKSTEEYSKMKAIDMARFILLTLNSSYHYYAITGAQTTLDEYLISRQFDIEEVAILLSGVSNGHRIIRLPENKEISQLYFLSEEGTGKIDENTFHTKEYEVVDIMKNGQSRFAIYDEKGNLLPAGQKEYSASGKPAKCLWCHETFVQPSFVNSPSANGYLSVLDFNEMVSTWNKGLDSMREELGTALNFQHQSEHELLEIMYISFMEPSAKRLASEWNMSETEILNMLQSNMTHIHLEFPMLGDLYHRKDIAAFSPYSSLAVPYDSRELSIFEPRYIEPR